MSSHVLAELDELADAAVYLQDGATASAERIEAARTSVRDWRIRSLDPLRLRSALVAAGVDGDLIAPDPQGVLVPIASEKDASHLLAALVAAGVPISAFAPAIGDLEHTFLDLTGEGAS